MGPHINERSTPTLMLHGKQNNTLLFLGVGGREHGDRWEMCLLM